MKSVRYTHGLISFNVVILGLVSTTTLSGCGPYYPKLRIEGQQKMAAGEYGAARQLFTQAYELLPYRVANLYDLGTCSVMLARERFEQKNQAAAMRELDAAISYFSQALDVFPGHQPSIEGMSEALELKGEYDKALAKAEWAVEVVGPTADQYMFLARKLEERGDVDGALKRYRQAVAVEPKNATAQVALAKFLLRQDNEQAAIKHLQAAYRLNPSDDWVVDQLAARGAVPPLAEAQAKSP